MLVAWLPALPALLAKALASPARLLAAAVASEMADPATEAIEDPAARASEAAAVASDKAAEAREVADAKAEPTEFTKDSMLNCGRASGLGLGLALAFGFARLEGRRTATKATVAKFVVRILTVSCGFVGCSCFDGGLRVEVDRRQKRRKTE
jgi:hypothetical protein